MGLRLGDPLCGPIYNGPSWLPFDIFETPLTRKNNEPRAMLQIMLSTVINQEIDNGDIETVNAEGELFGPDGKIVEVDISVSKT